MHWYFTQKSIFLASLEKSKALVNTSPATTFPFATAPPPLILLDPTHWFVYPSCLHPPPTPSSGKLRLWFLWYVILFQISPSLLHFSRIVLGVKRKHPTNVFCSSFLLPFSCLELDHDGWILSSHLVTIRQPWSLKHMLRVGKHKDRNWGVDHIMGSLTSPRSPTAKFPVIWEEN